MTCSSLNIVYPHNQKLLIRRANDVVVMKTCHALAARGHRVHLLYGKGRESREEVFRHYGLSPLPSFQLVPVPVLRRTRPPALSWHKVYEFFCWRTLRRIMSRERVDLLYAREPKIIKPLAGKLAGRLPLVFEVHQLSHPAWERPELRERHLMHGVQGLATINEILRERIVRFYDPPFPVCKVPLAAGPVESPSPFRPPADGGPWRLMYVGQLHAAQGVDLALEALCFLPDSFLLEVVGGTESQTRELRRKSEHWGVASRLALHGFTPPARLDAVASRAHLFLLPALPQGKRSLASHTKLYEYMAWGRPVAASDLPSVREDLGEGKAGALFEPGSPKSLAETVLRLTSRREGLMEMADEARKRARLFTWEQRAIRLEQCFEEVLRRGKTARENTSRKGKAVS